MNSQKNFVRTIGLLIIICILVVQTALALAAENQGDLVLWYRQPAKQWVEALPVGNGRLGAMVFGGIENERLQLNEDTLSAGGPYDPTNPNALAALPEARRLIFAGDFNQANKLIGAKMMARPMTQMPYQPLGDLLLSFPNLSGNANYRRQLDLDTAIARVDFNCGDVNFTREVFSSPVDQVLVVRLTADKPGQISFIAALNTPHKATVKAEGLDTLVMRGVNRPDAGIKAALKFQAILKVQASGGKTIEDQNRISVENADSATLLLTTNSKATS